MPSSIESNTSGSQTATDAAPPPPEDRYNLVYCACVLCGVSFLMPWNSITMAVDFFKLSYPGTNIMFAISLSYIVVLWLGTTLSNMTTEWLNPTIKVIFGSVVSVGCLLYLAVVEAWWQPFPLEVSYHLVLVCCVIVSLGAAIMQTNLYGLFSMLPMKYTQGIMVGESVAGTFTVLTRIFTKAAIPSIHTSTIIFFASSLVLSVLCLVAFLLTVRSSYLQYHVHRCTIVSEEGEETVLLKYDAERQEIKDNTNEYGSTVGVKVHNGDVKGSVSREPLTIRIKRALDARIDVVRTIWPYMLAFWFDYFVTLGVFPGLSSEVIQCSIGSWMPVIMLSVFNVFDTVGKIGLFTRIEYDWPVLFLGLGSAARVVLIPLFILCATPRLHPVIGGMALPIILSSVNGLTNGFFGSVPIILAPTKVTGDKKQLAGNIMVLSLATGLASGSASAYGYLDILEPLTAANNPCLQNSTLPT